MTRSSVRLSSLVSLVVLAVISVAGVVGAQPSHGQMYLIHQEVAKPSMIQAYESATKDFMAMVGENPAAAPHFQKISCLMSDNFTYTFVVPIPNMGAVDSISAEFGALAQAGGTKFADMMKRGDPTTEYVKESVVQLAPELSYVPASPRLKGDEMRYFHYDFYYVQYGHDADADTISKDFLALFKSKNIPNGYRIFKSVMGPEMPVIIVEAGAKDAADYEAARISDMAALGDAAKVLFGRAFAITRRFETKTGVLRPDLSIFPMPAATK